MTQEALICWTIGIVRQLEAAYRLDKNLDIPEDFFLSIQELIDIIPRRQLRVDGGLKMKQIYEHLLLITGYGTDEYRQKIWEAQDSYGLNQGVDGYI